MISQFLNIARITYGNRIFGCDHGTALDLLPTAAEVNGVRIELNQQSAVLKQRDDKVDRAIEAILNASISLDENSLVCGFCRYQEGHAETCLVPTLEQWRKAN